MRSIILFCLLFASNTLFAQGFTAVSNKSVCKSKIEAKSKSTSSITADFDETVHSSMFNQAKKGAGVLMFKKESKIRWEHTSPEKQIILINGTKVRLFENGKENKNTTSNQVIKKVQSLMMQLFSGDFLNEKEFNIGYYENAKEYKLILTPKSSRIAKYIENVEMYFDKSKLTLNSMVMKESEDDFVVYEFSSIKMNSSISDSNFTQF